MSMPDTYTSVNKTGCCAVPNVEQWNEQIIEFREKRFIRMCTKSFMYVPRDMDQVMTKIQRKAEDADALMPESEAMVLSRDLSPWKAEQLFAVSKEVPGVENIFLSGQFATKVFEGPYSDAKKWMTQTLEYVKKLGRTSDAIYFFYTTCPKCAQAYGKNFTIAFAKLN